ncbi:hypothetical protein SCA6_005334 [Theobroma cacao]
MMQHRQDKSMRNRKVKGQLTKEAVGRSGGITERETENIMAEVVYILKKYQTCRSGNGSIAV